MYHRDLATLFGYNYHHYISHFAQTNGGSVSGAVLPGQAFFFGQGQVRSDQLDSISLYYCRTVMQRTFFGKDAGHNFRAPLSLERNSFTQVLCQAVSLLENKHSTCFVPGHLEDSPLYFWQINCPRLVRSS
jgi:hypothetical protein